MREARERRARYVVWSAGELATFLEVANDDHHFPLWRLLAATGMRRGEARGLQWGDVDLAGESLSQRRSLGEDRRGGRRTPSQGGVSW